MKPDCKTKNPLTRDGTNQKNRFPAALEPSYVSIDEKHIDDLLVQIKKYAESVKFINFDKDINGNWIEIADGSWIDFFTKDISVILSLISTKDCQKLQDDYKELSEKLKKNLKDETKAKEKYTLLYNLINSAANEIKTWRNSFKTDYELFHEINNEEYKLSDSYALLSTYEPSVFLTGSGPALLEKIEDAIDILDALFNTFLKSYTKIVNRAKDYLNASLENFSEHSPQTALLLAFLKLFKIAQSNLNNFTKRHLDFYYKEVLRLKEKNEVPDKVHITFELAKNISEHLLNKGVLLSAGKDSTGKEIQFALDNDLVINTVKVESIKNVFIDRNNKYLVSSSPIANSIDGIGGELPKDNPKWKPFGQSQFEKGALIEPQTMTFTEIGFAISSPVLLLNEGTRKIDLDFELVNSSIYSKADLDDTFKIYLSGEKEWIEVTSYEAKSTPGITFTLPAETPPVVNYNSSKLDGNFDTSFPIIKFILKTGLDKYPYKKLKDYKITKIKISVEVSGIKNLITQNDLGVQKTGKPFQPFGAIPAVGSAFYLGSSEVFSKKLDELEVSVVWHEMPQANMGNYYKVYNSSLTNESFKAKASLLDKNNWIELKDVQLFKSIKHVLGKPSKKISYNTNKFAFSDELKSLSGYLRDPEMESVGSYEVNTSRGFIRLVLTPHDFFHNKFAKLYTEKVIAKVSDGTVELPNQPYTPVIHDISLDYKSTAEILFNTSVNFEKRVDKLFHIYPFGYKEAHPVLDGTGPSEFMFPQFVSGAEENEGELYIGLSNVNVPQSVSLLFQVAEGSSNPNVCKPKINWFYLSSKSWIKFADSQILSDSTDGLVNSGIISFDIPEGISNTDSLINGSYFWLRASVNGNSAGVCDLIDIRAQAVRATFVYNGNDPNRLAAALPAGLISKLKSKDSAVKTITQPFSSFGGMVKEQSFGFYRRVSERLRHKHRASAMWDYERIVLQEFPEIYKVKCLNHTKLVQCDDCGFFEHTLSPGHVTVITVPNLRNKNAVDPFKPYTSIGTLTKIEEYLKKLISPFICLYVNNPKFEEIQVEFDVRFRMGAGADTGYLQKKLNEDIKKFLSPWAYDEGQDITFGGKIHKSAILDFAEDLPYVDYLTNFKMNHIGIANDVEEAIAATSRSILVTISDKDYKKEHQIKLITEADVNDGISNYCKKPEAVC